MTRQTPYTNYQQKGSEIPYGKTALERQRPPGTGSPHPSDLRHHGAPQCPHRGLDRRPGHPSAHDVHFRPTHPVFVWHHPGASGIRDQSSHLRYDAGHRFLRCPQRQRYRQIRRMRPYAGAGANGTGTADCTVSGQPGMPCHKHEGTRDAHRI